MALIVKKHIATGITWVAIEAADVYICCGCPPDAVKHLKKAGIIHELRGDEKIETGPNCILLSDTLIQNGQIDNLAEFPVLQMLYMQGTNLPDHANYKKFRPMLIGCADQVKSQINYIAVGNHGLATEEEIRDTGIPEVISKKIFTTKTYFSGGKITPVEELVTPRILEDEQIEIKNGVFISRIAINKFDISYEHETISVDLNLSEKTHFTAPYSLPLSKIEPDVFSITHSGEGNGWDVNRPCMAGIIRHRDHIYLVDAGPNILNNLEHLSIGISEIEGIFLSHIHDDHFAGITELLRTERKLNLYATALIHKTAERKLKALLNSEMDLLQMSFNCIDLKPDEWNILQGMEIKPFYSPHTVETNVFHFRVLEGQNYKTYVHLSDAINFNTYRQIIDTSQGIFSEADMDYVKEAYLSKVDLKKIDVGGGLIHGNLSDYAKDNSGLLVMAHTDGFPNSEQSNIINVNFGETHVLIHHEDFSIWKKRAIEFLRVYFPMLNKAHIEELIGLMGIREFSPGEMLPKSMDSKGNCFLILSGLVEQKNESRMRFDAGNIVGNTNKYFGYSDQETYSALSYVTCMEMDEESMDQLMHDHHLKEAIDARRDIITKLQKSDVIQNIGSTALFTHLASAFVEVTIAKNDLSEESLRDHIYILLEGKVKAQYFHGKQQNVFPYEFFGGENVLQNYRENPNYIIENNLKVLSISIDQVTLIPKLIWAMIDLEEERCQKFSK